MKMCNLSDFGTYFVVRIKVNEPSLVTGYVLKKIEDQNNQHYHYN